jgi:signal transduction histidine kinase
LDSPVDVRGVFAACAVVFLGLTASMALGWRELRGRAGLAQFAAGYGGVVVSAALFALRGRVPDVLVSVAANAVLVAAAALILEGTRLFSGAPREHVIGRLAVALAVVAFPWLGYVQAGDVPRTILSNGLVAALLAVAAWTAARHRSRGERLLDVITSVALACCAAAFGARAALKGAAAFGIDLRDGDPSAAVAALAGTLAAVIWTMTVLTSANRRLTLEVSREKDRLMLLNQVLVISARSRDAEEITAAAADAIAQTNGWVSVSVALPGEDGLFRFRGNAAGSAGARQGLAQGVIGRAYASGMTQLVEDVGTDPDYVAYSPEVRSELAVPLRRNGRTLGVLNLESVEAITLGADEIPFAESLAEAISLGLENARLERARDEVTHLMVHDLRSPMVSITGALDLLGHAAGLAPRDQGLLQMARRNAARQNALIDSILDIWQLEEGAYPDRRASVAVGTVVADALRLAEPRAQARKLELVGDVAEELPLAWVDPALMERVLANLVDNAIKFSPEGGGPVTVSVRSTGALGIRLSVSDCGPGVEDALRPRLFSRFAPGAHTSRGSGLGLAFCRLAVEASGGQIWLEEREGPGALFVFTMPSAVNALPQPAPPTRKRGLTGSPQNDLLTP